MIPSISTGSALLSPIVNTARHVLPHVGKYIACPIGYQRFANPLGNGLHPMMRNVPHPTLAWRTGLLTSGPRFLAAGFPVWQKKTAYLAPQQRLPGANQQRPIFHMVRSLDPAEWPQEVRQALLDIAGEKDSAKLPELAARLLRELGCHGTNTCAVDSIREHGIDVGLTGKYRGGKSFFGEGLYLSTVLKVAIHYARRAVLGAMGIDHDDPGKPQTIMVHVAHNGKLVSQAVPEYVLDKPELIAEFRRAHPDAHQFELGGKTPVPKHLESLGSTTIVIAAKGIDDPNVLYLGVARDPIPLRPER